MHEAYLCYDGYMSNPREGNSSIETLEAELARLQALLDAKQTGAAMMQAEGIEVGVDDPDKADLEEEYRAVRAQLINLGAIQPELPNI